jgi:hypothetical protein
MCPSIRVQNQNCRESGSYGHLTMICIIWQPRYCGSVGIQRRSHPRVRIVWLAFFTGCRGGELTGARRISGTPPLPAALPWEERRGAAGIILRKVSRRRARPPLEGSTVRAGGARPHLPQRPACQRIATQHGHHAPEDTDHQGTQG